MIAVLGRVLAEVAWITGFFALCLLWIAAVWMFLRCVGRFAERGQRRRRMARRAVARQHLALPDCDADSCLASRLSGGGGAR